MVEECEIPELLGNLYDFSFPAWLNKYSEQFRPKGTKPGDHEHYDAIVAMLSVSVTDEEGDPNVELVLEKDLIPYIAEIFQGSDWNHQRYIPCLKLIANLSNSSSDCAD